MGLFGSPKVVIVEDDEALSEIYQTRMQLLGYKCVTARDGAEGLALIEKELPDLVLLDLMMPVMSGDQVLAAMRASDWGKDIKVLILSNLSESEAPANLRENGIEGYLVKANLVQNQLDEVVADVLGVQSQE